MGQRVRFLAVLFLFSLCLRCGAQVQSEAEYHRPQFTIGAGLDYWSGNYSGLWRYGPSAWVSMDVWRNFGILAEGHSMMAPEHFPDYKYFVGEGGLVYTIHRWEHFQPYAKAELGFAGLSVERSGTYRSHDTRNTWALGGGAEFHAWRPLWTRVDYTYDGFPSFLSFKTFEKHTLNPTGITVGLSYHIR